MQIRDWLERYAEQVKKIEPGTSDTAAIWLAVGGLGRLVNAEISSVHSPEQYAYEHIEDLKRRCDN